MSTAQLALAPVDSAPASAVHLTRRGRFLLLGLPVLAVLAIALFGALMLATSLLNQAQASSGEVPGVDAQVVTVGAGDTLWSVAASVDSDEHTQVLIGQIAELNDLNGSEITPGQELFVPVD